MIPSSVVDDYNDKNTNINNINNTTSNNNINDDEEDEDDYKLKWCCRLFQLRFIVDWKFSFTFLCVCCFFENFVIAGTATVILSTLEKEFYLSSGQSGLFLSIYEFSAFIASPIVGFLGNRFNKMKTIAVSLFIISLGYFKTFRNF